MGYATGATTGWEYTTVVVGLLCFLRYPHPQNVPPHPHLRMHMTRRTMPKMVKITKAAMTTPVMTPLAPLLEEDEMELHEPELLTILPPLLENVVVNKVVVLL
eukprot:TRINITY_DN14098_c0_g1_i4.p4 TRINITY_DN14098_c0_g1~~TRINITY_DN14098_c0_g1_i4.p4  ORF type:complete len:103 (-),score=10.88 TRINITY_DN14098_c0_g1_i4:308-616(-)